MKVGFRTVSFSLACGVVAGFQAVMSSERVANMDDLKPNHEWREFSDGPGVLVIASDHGEGTSALSHALGAHPCLISVGEAFGTTSQRWFSPNGNRAFFNGDGGRGEDSEYSKLQSHLDEALALKGYATFNLSKDLQILHPTLPEFFRAVRKEVCEHVELPRMCGSRCVLAHKLFPLWFSYNFSFVEDYLKSPYTMVLEVIRDEAAVIKSNQERFNMGKRAIRGHRAWNSYLNVVQAETETTKIWTNISTNEDVYKSPKRYLGSVIAVLPFFGLPINHAVSKSIGKQIDEEFANYAEKKERLEQMSGGDTNSSLIDKVF